MANTVSKSLPRVATAPTPSAGAVHLYQTDLAATAPCAGSPVSAVAAVVKAVAVAVAPESGVAAEKLSLAGEAIGGALSARESATDPVALEILSTAIWYVVPLVAAKLAPPVVVGFTAVSAVTLVPV